MPRARYAMSVMSETPSVDALYLHIPFCVQRCSYCDFITSAVAYSDPLIEGYVQALIVQLRASAQAGLLRRVRTAYVGGGTPSYVGEGLVELVREIRALCPDLEELSCEANPESLTGKLACELAAAGATRISLGVQSLNDAELACLGRIHSAADARRAAHEVVSSGLDLSCDLMCGIPLQTSSSWENSLIGVLETGAVHVSVYPLTVEEGTPLAQACERGELSYPDEDFQADLLECAEQLLTSAGLARYEVASYARPGKRCAHNEAYWTGHTYLGIGTGAASMLSLSQFEILQATFNPTISSFDDDTLSRDVKHAARVRCRVGSSARELAQGEKAACQLSLEVETLTAREAACEDLMLGMRLVDGVPASLLNRVEHFVGSETLHRAMRQAQLRGLAELHADGSLRPTHQGWLLGNELYGIMWDLAYEDRGTTESSNAPQKP